MGSCYKRILLKLSGEALAGEKGFGISSSVVTKIAKEIAEIHKKGIEIGIVIGGGNILRGATTEGVSRVAGDTMGMLATVINSLAMKEYLQSNGVNSKILTAVNIDSAGEFFTTQKANESFKKREIVIIAGGTGNPFFTTDTAAALRCAEIGADVLMKATKVDGIYDSDPVKNPSAIRYEHISHSEAIEKGLKVMDETAFSFCRENNIPIIIFKLTEDGNLRKCIEGQPVGSIITTGG